MKEPEEEEITEITNENINKFKNKNDTKNDILNKEEDNKNKNIKEIDNNKNIDGKKENTQLKTSEILESVNLKDEKNKESEDSILIIKSKILKLKNDYIFFHQYQDILLNIVKYLEDLTYEKVNNSINDSYNYISFFQSSSEIYSKFAEQIKNTNNIIISSKQLPKMNDNFLHEIMQNTQNIIYLNLSKISNGLKQNIISNGPMSKFEEKINKIDSIKKKQLKIFNEIEEMKNKLEKKYLKSYAQLFESLLKENINNEDLFKTLTDSPDLICIVKDLLDDINKLILEINLFIIDAKDSLYSINHLFVEINNLVRDSVLIYIQESKNNFNIDVTKNFEQIQKYYKNLEENPEDKMFKLDKIFNEQIHKEKIYNLLEQYYNLLNKSERIRKELITDKNNFLIKNYPNIYLFFEFLISVCPQPTQITIDDLIIKQIEVKRDAGFFRGWKDSMLIFTKQKHILLYDKPVTYTFENIIQIFEIDKTNFEKKVDFKKPFLFTITISAKGKIMDYGGTFLFDALSNENFYDISLVYKDYIN